jgi:tripartite-type tricarboxylate transporter receptor subunit TctC
MENRAMHANDSTRTTRHIAGATLAIAVACFAGDAAAQNAAQSYPNKPIRVIVPVVPGGASDLLARLIGPQLTAAWGQQVVVENRAGAGGQIGVEGVARSVPDGYTLLFWDYGSLTIATALRPTFRVDPVKDLATVTVASYSPHVLGAHPSVPASSVKELIAIAKAQPDKLNYAITGLGSAPHLAAVLLALQTGIKWVYIPTKGGAQAMFDVISGQADVLFNSMFAMLPYVKTKQLKLLAVSSPKRMAAIPDTLTVIESGVPGFVTGSSQGMLAPAAVPPEILNKLHAQIAIALAQPEMRQKLAAQGAEVVAQPPEKTRAFLREEQARWTRVAKEAKITLD